MIRKKIFGKKLVSLFVILTMFTVMFAGQALGEWTTNGPAGLGINDIAMDPNNGNIVYVVGGTNAVYKSINGGASFIAYEGGILEDDDLQALAIDPNYPFVIYACGKYFYRSEDAGQTWLQVGDDLPPCYSSLYCHKDILVDPFDPYIVYVATWAYDPVHEHSGGVYKSEYFGNTFDDITQEDVDGFLASCLTMDSADHLIIYAGVECQSVNGEGGVWRTDDGGETWIQDIHLAPELAITSVEADPNIPGRLFAGGLNTGCWRSDTYGEDWEQVLFNAGGYDIAVRGTTVFYACGSGLYRSFSSGDNGSWTRLSNPDTGLCTISISEIQDGLIFVGGGLFFFKNLLKSTDYGDSFTSIVVSRFQWLNVYDVASATRGSTVYSCGDFGSFGEGGLFTTANNGYSWFQTMFPTWRVTDVYVCPDNPDIVLATMQWDVAGSHPTYRSTDGGSHFSVVSIPHVLDLVFDPLDTSKVYASVYIMQPPFNWLYRSTDSGGTWEVVCNTPRMFTVLVYSHSEELDILYGGTSNGVYKSIDGGIHWNQAGLTGLEITSLSLCYLNGGGIVAGTNTGVYRTIDGGDNWQQIGLSGIEINDIFSDVIETHFFNHAIYFRQVLFAATNQGVYEYINNNWVSRNDGLDSLEVRELTLTKPLPFSIVPERRIGLVMQEVVPRILSLSEGKGFTDSGQGPQNPLFRIGDDVVYQVRRSVLHAATPLGTYEYVFIEP